MEELWGERSRWLKDCPLGEGQSGEVWSVREKGGARRLGAAKVFRGAAARVSRAEFLKEIRFFRENAGRDAVPRLLDSGAGRSPPFYVMELLEDLREPSDEKGFLMLCRKVIEAVRRFHRLGYFHCDIKPNNLARRRGAVFLVDYGSVCKVSEAATRRVRVGSPHYMAPEVRAGGCVSLLSEIYSLGVTLDEMCHGDVRDIYAPVLSRAFAADPKARPSSLEELERDLAAAGPRYRRQVARKSRSTKFKLAVALVLVVWGCLTGLFLLRQAHVRAARKNVVAITAHVRAGLILHERRSFAAAVEHLEAAARHPDFDTLGCQHERVYRILAECYRDGKGVAPDPAKSRYYRLKGR